MNLAVIDIGTNSVHMLIVRVDADLKFHVLDKAKEMARLGQGTFESGRLDEATQRRGLDSLMRFRRTGERRGVERYIAAATSAVREAENGGAFLQEVYERTGIHAQIISGAEEARLVFKAVQNTMPLDEDPTLVVDLGGGSAEFALGTARQLQWTTSLKVGVQRLESIGLRKGEVNAESRQAMHAHLQREFAAVARKVKGVKLDRCVVTSGSATAVLKLLRAKGLVDNDKEILPRKALADLDDELAEIPRVRRAALPEVEPARVDLIVPAVAFFRGLAEALDLQQLRVSDAGLREGMVYDFLDRHGADLQWELLEPNTRRRAVLQFAERFHFDAPHAHQVARLAVNLFDATQALHRLDEDARELLEYGALLHDIGYAVAAKEHHKHSEYLILNGLAATGGFTEIEVRIIAGIARYHRKAVPKRTHELWRSMTKAEQDVVGKTAALLRIADGLDRSHSRIVGGIKAVVEGRALRIDVQAEDAVELEIWGALRKADLFEELFGRTVEIHGPTGRVGQRPQVKPRAAAAKQAKVKAKSREATL